MGTRVMTTNNIDRELGQSNELRDNDLECVVGGLTVTKEVDASSPNLTVGTGPELTEDELNHVSGGKYMEFKLKEVLISGVTPPAGANVPPSL
jgi:bacteriocin-like protein